MSVKNTVAILGAGRIARVHAESLNRYAQNVTVKYIIDPYMDDKMRKWAETINISYAENDSARMFADREVDSIFICSPTPTHCDYILKACESGKNVYCEKPLDSDISRIYKAMEVVEKSGIKFLMGFMRRFDTSQRKMKDIIASGKVGAPQIIKLCSRDPALPSYGYIKTSGGIYFDSMIHDFDLARYFSDSEVVEVYATGKALIDSQVGELGDVDTAAALLKFESGAIGLIDLSRQSNCGYDQRTEVHASKGFVQVGNVPESSVIVNNEHGVTHDRPVYFFLERYEQAFVNAQRTFFDIVNKDKEPPVTMYDGLQAVRIAKAARTSYLENRPVKLSEIE